ncbi:MAG: SDR family NAD(P)-dependent oxidoreductase, partial [Actinobacteria bacterium]|nr:SDR family NAD(P)-dependent oxidoreductase [Actinomycetota bacterium]
MTVGGPHAGRVVVVTGGGAGIGAAVATELGRQGADVVTVDPLVSVDGTASAASAEPTTADRIVAAGGSARASNTSVTDRAAVVDLFSQLVDEHGRLDAVVNVAGITRPTGFAKGDEADWAAVLSVHLDGYRNVLDAALPIMAAAGSGQVLGVTSGSGWRAADAGAYSCAKRAVASLTWQLGRAVPHGVEVNAMSPIAMTRMVTEALARAGAAQPTKGSSATGGLSLGAMPAPEHLGPLGAHLVAPPDGRRLSRRGRILFAGGSEVAVVEPPRLVEVVRTSGATSVGHVLDATLDALVAAESAQATTGGSNARFGPIFDEPSAERADASDGRVAVVTDRADLGGELVAALDALGADVVLVPTEHLGSDFADARGVLDHAAGTGPLDAVVVALATPGPVAPPPGEGWEAVLADHDGLAGLLLADAAWARAASDHAAATDRPLRLVTVVDAATAGGRSRAQAAAQLARASRRATKDGVAAFAVAAEDRGEVAATAALAARLATREAAVGLAGAELAVRDGWIGLRSHPRPGTSVVF